MTSNKYTSHGLETALEISADDEHIAPSNGATKKNSAEKLAKLALIHTNSVTLAC